MGKIQDRHLQTSLEIIAAVAPKIVGGKVVDAICAHGGVDLGTLRRKTADGAHAALRMAAYCLLRERGYSYPRIAKLFRRDSSTVVHMVQVLEEKIGGSPREPEPPSGGNLPDIISFSESRYEISLREDLTPQTLEYLARHAREQPSIVLLANRLLLFSYLMGTVPILLRNGQTRRIGKYADGTEKPLTERAQDLPYLAPVSCQMLKPAPENACDTRLRKVYHSTIRAMPWNQFVESSAADPTIIAQFGRPIQYYGDVCERWAGFKRK